MYNMIEKVNCKVCGTDKKPDLVLIKKAYELSKCRTCKVIFASRRLKKELISNLYINYVPSAFTDMQQEELKDRGKKKLEDRVIDAKYQLSILHKHVKIGKMLDIGAAGATFLDVAQKQGWKIRGTELSDNCVNIAHSYYSINLFKGDIIDFREKNFDAIVLWNVLEHLYEPYNEILHLRKLLNKDGIILIKVPNHTHETLIKDPMLPGHIFNFNLDSLQFLFDKTSFEILEVINGFDGDMPTLIIVIRAVGNFTSHFSFGNIDNTKIKIGAL